mmetsp:Transcript_4200/g.5838  ORF Transcript_4200/g.5838 Transcript_4200/m.5838 type:complete len:155 (+) Transcript_4200:1-465(+)
MTLKFFAFLSICLHFLNFSSSYATNNRIFTKNLKKLLNTAAIITISSASLAEATLAANDDGARLFEQYCIGCHLGGGNVIGYARNKTLKLEALRKGGFDSKEAMTDLLKKGAGAMPKYTEYTKSNGDVVPAKLNDREIEEVVDYVLLRASQAWK